MQRSRLAGSAARWAVRQCTATYRHPTRTYSTDKPQKLRMPWEMGPNPAMEQERTIEELEEFLLEQETVAEEDDGVNANTGSRAVLVLASL